MNDLMAIVYYVIAATLFGVGVGAGSWSGWQCAVYLLLSAIFLKLPWRNKGRGGGE